VHKPRENSQEKKGTHHGTPVDPKQVDPFDVPPKDPLSKESQM
jgi:hypothetical protein